MFEHIVERVKLILFNPDEAWIEVKNENVTVSQLFKDYLIILAGIPAIAGFIGALIAQANFFNALLWGILFYGLSLCGVWLIVKILLFLTKNFNISCDEISIYKLVSYSYTAFFVAGFFLILPFLYWLTVLVGLYSFYLFIIGLPHFVVCPKEEKFNFIVIAVIAIIFSQVLVFVLSGAISSIDITYLKM